jgi:hypothetical protein
MVVIQDRSGTFAGDILRRANGENGGELNGKLYYQAHNIRVCYYHISQPRGVLISQDAAR